MPRSQKHLGAQKVIADHLQVQGVSELAGSLTVATGDVTVTAGDVTVTAGDIVASAGNVVQKKHTFSNAPTVIQDDGTIGTLVDTEVNINQFNDGLQLNVQNIGTNPNVPTPAVNANGLDFNVAASAGSVGTQWVTCVNNQQIIEGVNAFTIGTSAAFFIELVLQVATVANTDECQVGFITQQAFQAAAADYTDKAVLNIDSTVVQTVTALNNAGDTTTALVAVAADATEITFRVNVSAAGVVTYLIDGAADANAVTFTFDDTDVVVPFGRILNNGSDAGVVAYKSLAFGLQ